MDRLEIMRNRVLRAKRRLDRSPIHSRMLWAFLAAALVVLLVPASVQAQEKTYFDKALELGPVLGPLVAAVVAFGFGLGTCATPCVYPMITITVSIFGAREAKSRREAMLLSTCFVLGIVALFTPLFVGAALSGTIFGAALANRYVVSFLALVFVALALSMFGLFELALPESLQQRLSGVGGVGYGGAFVLGLVCSLVASPCVGPVAGSILIFIAKTRSLALGGTFGAMYAIGLGIPFWLVGTFAVSLPKSGKWMVGVKSTFGIAMIVTALYFLKNSFPAIASLARPGTAFLVGMIAVAGIGLALGAVHLDWADGGIGVKVRKTVGIAAAVVGIFLLIARPEMPKSDVALADDGARGGQPVLTWEHEEASAVSKARTEKRPLLVDFTAEWCGACKKLSRETFNDPRVMHKAGNFVAVRVDATNDEDPQVDAVKGKYKVVGLPTVVIYDSKGAERKRFNDFIGPDQFLAAIDGID
jgi:thiol:disulfide interchange protein DsbD